MIRPSQLPDSMMSKPAQGFMSSVSPQQILGLDGPVGTMATASLGRPMPGPLPRYPHSEAMQYNGSYFSYRLCGQDGGGGELASAWSPSMAYLGSSSSSSPTVPTAATEGSIRSPIVYRHEKVSLPAGSGGSPLIVAQELAGKRMHAVAGYYPDRSQAQCSSSSSPSAVTPSAMRQTESPVGLAIPKPVYGHNACCSDMRCTAGYNTMEQGLHRTPTSIYEDEWLMGYSSAVPLTPSRKDLDMLLEQRGLHAEPRAERAAGKEVASEEFCDLDTFLNRRGSVYSDVNHSSYACSPTSSAPFIGAPPDPCQRFQFPSKEYPGFPSSHPHMYDPLSAQYGVPRKVYPEYSHHPSYVQVPQRSRAYYPPQDHMEAQKASACTAGMRRKYSDGTPSPSPERRDTLSSPIQCSLPQHVPPTVFASPPAHCHVRFPRYRFAPRNFDHLAYRPYQMHLNDSHPKNAPVRPPSCPLPPRHAEKPLDYSLHRGQPGSSPCQFPVPSSLSEVVPPPPHTPEHRSSKLHHAGSVKMPPGYYMGATHFPVGVAGKYSASDKQPSDMSDPKAHYGDSLAKSHCETQLNARDKVSSGGADVYEVEVTAKKRKKIDMVQETAALPKPAASPPMPVINQVFSLAPYKLYLEAAGVLPMVKRCNSAEDSPQLPGTPKQDPEISEGNEKRERCDSRNSYSADGSEETTETVTLKTEKTDHPREHAVENSLCNRQIIKRESCTDATEGECRSALKTDQQTDRHSPILAEDAVAKCKVEVTSGRNTETTASSNKGTEDVAPVVRPAVKSPPPVTLALKSVPSPQTNPIQMDLQNLALKSVPSSQMNQPIRVDLQNIPPQCLKLSTHNIVLPEVLQTSVRPVPLPPPPLLKFPTLPTAPQSPADPTPDASVQRQARHQFMELHQSLCRLIYTLATQTPPQELRDWLFKMELGNKTTYPPDKHQRVASMVGARAREVWARTGERSLTLQKLLGKLKGYEAHGECPFPHVMRAGGIFVPMLVVKEGLFPQVHGTFIDQVLQEHRVELRPTTLSEEKHLTQLQKRACSSKLRRLLSLRHLPDIYADVLNLFYYTSVCKALDSTSHVAAKKTPQM
ncbi:uncharacterized protein C15orf39 homolog [Alosa sapidissima]|nr:uncharacterized protein C15orf39 homolog [Alosa sapidissima]XP_041966151.1 uncharacterized protein C15orf39 homolog [Alosa sapidissima]XP_041966152.1 uncharacterized protein C15orf39 homolog [Alosa sapidissima]XP_041966153.1 uncharacterized protein C15orf39 homolog [Alosa sapidissima]XP_041966154.1 uncharacterized protein C15orf39 homolog [Alosa sapidissima]